MKGKNSNAGSYSQSTLAANFAAVVFCLNATDDLVRFLLLSLSPFSLRKFLLSG